MNLKLDIIKISPTIMLLLLVTNEPCPSIILTSLSTANNLAPFRFIRLPILTCRYYKNIHLWLSQIVSSIQLLTCKNGQRFLMCLRK